MNAFLFKTARLVGLAGLFLGTAGAQEEPVEADPEATPAAVREPLPISSFWESESFQRAFTASYGIDSRIEPKVSSRNERPGVSSSALVFTISSAMSNSCFW